MRNPNDIFKEIYTKALYRRNNQGKPCIWYAFEPTNNNDIYFDSYLVLYGVIGANNKIIGTSIKRTQKTIKGEIQSKINEKRKKGYKYLSELKDNQELPTFDVLLRYLEQYLPYNRTDADDKLLPMLAKTLKVDSDIFKNDKRFIAQPKINGLRCFISAYRNNNDLFKPISLQFQSREGKVWTSLANLEEELLELLPKKVLEDMVEDGYVLDGELYIPGYNINMINSAVKNPNTKENKLLQFWCYDLAIENMLQIDRLAYLYTNIGKFDTIRDKITHLKNKNTLILVNDERYCRKVETAIENRDDFINMGFEGVILRDPNSEYQFGKRNSSMFKFKRSTDGLFTIIDIYPEGNKRSNIPLILCKNDINDAEFECHVGGSTEYQERVLANKDNYIGADMFVEYGERSGVNQVPFHIKNTYIINPLFTNKDNV